MTQQINITYKVDKSQIDASNQSVEKAKNLTDQLTQSTQKFAQQGTRNNQQYSNTIEGTRIKMAQLKAQIDLTNQSDVKRLVQLRTQYHAAQRQLESYTGAVKKSAEASAQAATSTQLVTSGFGSLGNFIKGGLIIAAAKQLGEATLEATKLAGNVEGVERAFERAFPNSTKILNDLRTATRGTVSDFELMQRTLQATNLGVDVAQLPVLFEFAAARAQQTGESVDYLVDSIVRGIGRKSILVLDNLGLSATRLKEQFNGASLASRSVAEVTQGVAAIAKVELDKMGGYVETGATKISQLGAAWEGLRVAFAKRIEGSVAINFFTKLISDAKTLVQTQDQLAESEAKLRASREVDAFIQSKAYQDTKDNAEDRLYLLSLEVVRQVNLVNARKEEIKLLEQQKAAQDASNVSGGVTIARLDKIIAQQQLGKKTAEESIEILKKYIIELRKLSEVDTTQDGGIIQRKKAEIEELNRLIEETNRLSDIGADGTLIKRRDQAEKELAILLGKNKEIKKENQSVSEYLAYLSDLDLYQGKKMLEERVAARKKAAAEEIEIEKKAAEQRERDAKEHAQRIVDTREAIVNTAHEITNNIARAALEAEITEYDIKIAKAHEYYDTQIELAGDNERAKKDIRKREEKEIAELNKKRAAAEKRAALGGIIVSTALAIIKALATSATIYDGYVNAAIVAAEGVAQYAIASNAKYKDGVIDLKGPGTKTSDSIPAMLSKGESVMTADETASSRRTLKMIRSKKLNDKVLDRIMRTSAASGAATVFDDSRLLAASKRIEKAASGNDIVRKGHLIFEAKQEGDNLTKYVRSKSLNG